MCPRLQIRAAPLPRSESWGAVLTLSPHRIQSSRARRTQEPAFLMAPTMLPAQDPPSRPRSHSSPGHRSWSLGFPICKVGASSSPTTKGGDVGGLQQPWPSRDPPRELRPGGPGGRSLSRPRTGRSRGLTSGRRRGGSRPPGPGWGLYRKPVGGEREPAGVAEGHWVKQG